MGPFVFLKQLYLLNFDVAGKIFDNAEGRLYLNLFALFIILIESSPFQIISSDVHWLYILDSLVINSFNCFLI